MSRDGRVTREWGDGEYVFRFAIGEWEKIDREFDVGPYEFWRRLSLGTWRAKYPREAIRVMLQGGGSVVNEAGAIDDAKIRRLIDEYVDRRPVLSVVEFVTATIGMIMTEPEADKIPKSEAAKAMPQSFQTESSPSPLSSDGGQSSDTHPTKSETSRSGNSEPAKRDTSPPMVARKSRNRRPRMNTEI